MHLNLVQLLEEIQTCIHFVSINSEAFVALWLSSKEMDSVTQVQILAKAVDIFAYPSYSWERYEFNYLSTARYV